MWQAWKTRHMLAADTSLSAGSQSSFLYQICGPSLTQLAGAFANIDLFSIITIPVIVSITKHCECNEMN